MDKALQAKVLALREAGVTTPDICRDLNLEADVVIALLSAALTKVRDVPTVPKRPPGRPRVNFSAAYLDHLLEILSLEGKKSLIWTLPRFIARVGASSGSFFSIDTLRRYAQELGLTFSKELGKSSLPLEAKKLIIAKQPLVYILTHRTASIIGRKLCNIARGHEAS